MRLSKLLLALDAPAQGILLAGLAPPAALEAAVAHTHPHPLGGEVLRLWHGWCGAKNAEVRVDRGALIDALGPLRRQAMADELGAAEFRLLSRIVEGIDAAFDAQALRGGGRPLQS